MGRKSIPPLVLKDILRLRANGLSFREIGERCGLSHTAVRLYYQQAQAKDLKWDKAKYHSESKLVQEFKRLKTHPSKYHEPDFDEYAKLLYLRKIRGIDDAYAYYCEDDKSGEKYSRASFFRLLLADVNVHTINGGQTYTTTRTKDVSRIHHCLKAHLA